MHGINIVFRIPESVYSYNFIETEDVGQRMWEYNASHPLKSTTKELKNAQNLIKFYLNSNNNDLKNLKSWQKQRVIEKVENNLRLIYANDMGVLPEEVGGILKVWGEDFPELVEYRKHNPNSKILAYVTYPDEKIEKITSIKEFLEDVIPLFEKMKENYQTNYSQNEINP